MLSCSPAFKGPGCKISFTIVIDYDDVTWRRKQSLIQFQFARSIGGVWRQPQKSQAKLFVDDDFCQLIHVNRYKSNVVSITNIQFPLMTI